MKRYPLLLVILLATWATARPEVSPKPAVDIFKPDWIASYFPPALLVVRPESPAAIQKLFDEALAQVQKAKPVTLTPFPANQQFPKQKQVEPLAGRAMKSGDAGFLVLVSQTGRVTAVYVAFSSDKAWARDVATTIANATFEPARYNGKPVPVLLCWRRALDHSVSIQ